MPIPTKKNVYLVDLGTRNNRNLLPLGCGLISSYCQSLPELKKNYNFEILFTFKNLGDLVSQMDNPRVVGIACYVWNLKISLQLAKMVKEVFPNCTIVLGGYSVPKDPVRIGEFFSRNSAVDILVHGEGEITFSEILLSFLSDNGLTGVEGTSYKTPDSISGFTTSLPRDRIENLDILPSPFLNGVFDKVISKYGEVTTGAILETNRGCPFACTFCDWGDAEVNQVKKFSMDRVMEELNWLSKNKVFYIYGADANFGIFYQRDLQIAEHMAQLCQNKGFPKYYMINYTKNSHEKIVNLAETFRKGGITTTVTLAMQSYSPLTLEAIKRKNIKPKNFMALKKSFQDRKLSTYLELILGLPEETYESFVDGLENSMTSCLSDHFVIYLCYLLENTELGSRASQEKYQIESRECALGMSRREFNEDYLDPEIEKIVVATSSMPVHDWSRGYIMGYFCMVLFNFRLGFFISCFLRDQFGVSCSQFIEYIISEIQKNPTEFKFLHKGYEHLNNQKQMILDNKCSMSPVEGLGETTLSPYEGLIAIFLRDVDSLNEELERIAKKFLDYNNFSCDSVAFKEIFLYQAIRTPSFRPPEQTLYNFRTNIPDYFDALINGMPTPPLEKASTTVELSVPVQESETFLDFILTRIMAGHTMHINDLKIIRELQEA